MAPIWFTGLGETNGLWNSPPPRAAWYLDHAGVCAWKASAIASPELLEGMETDRPITEQALVHTHERDIRPMISRVTR